MNAIEFLNIIEFSRAVEMLPFDSRYFVYFTMHDIEREENDVDPVPSLTHVQKLDWQPAVDLAHLLNDHINIPYVPIILARLMTHVTQEFNATDMHKFFAAYVGRVPVQ